MQRGRGGGGHTARSPARPWHSPGTTLIYLYVSSHRVFPPDECGHSRVSVANKAGQLLIYTQTYITLVSLVLALLHSCRHYAGIAIGQLVNCYWSM